MPGRETAHQVQPLAYSQVVFDRLAAQVEVVAEARHVQQLARAQRQHLQQAPHRGGVADPRDVLHVALQQCAQVLAMPGAGAGGGRRTASGKPPATMRSASTSGAHGVDNVIAGRSRPARSAPRNRPGARACSAAVSGCSCTTSIRPASESPSPRRRSRLAEPVSTKRPGLLSRSTASLSVRSSSGTRWISSRIARAGSADTKPVGSARAKESVAASSKVTYA